MLMGLFYMSLDMETLIKTTEDGAPFEGQTRAFKRSSQRAAFACEQMRAAKVAKRDAQAQGSSGVAQPGSASHVVIDILPDFSPSGPTSKQRSGGRSARKTIEQLFIHIITFHTHHFTSRKTFQNSLYSPYCQRVSNIRTECTHRHHSYSCSSVKKHTRC